MIPLWACIFLGSHLHPRSVHAIAHNLFNSDLRDNLNAPMHRKSRKPAQANSVLCSHAFGPFSVKGVRVSIVVCDSGLMAHQSY